MKKLIIAASAFAIALCAEPNFSGAWKLNVSKSDFGQFPAPSSVSTTIKHEGVNLDVHTELKGERGDFTTDNKYTTDGKECTNRGRFGEVKSTLKFDGDALLFNSKADFNGNEVQIKDKWTVSGEGKILTMERKFASSQGEMEQKQVFDKE